MNSNLGIRVGQETCNNVINLVVTKYTTNFATLILNIFSRLILVASTGQGVAVEDPNPHADRPAEMPSGL